MKTEEELTEIVSNEFCKIQLLCRICLTEIISGSSALLESGNNTKLSSLSHKITLCTRVKIDVDDKLPKKICEVCQNDLLIADVFRTKCEASDSLLRKVLDGFAIKSEIPFDSSKIDYNILEDNKDEICDLPISDIKKEAFEFDFEDDSEYVPEFSVKKKRKRKTQDEKKCKKKRKTDCSNDRDVSIKEEADNFASAGDVNLSSEDFHKGISKKFICDVCTKPLSTKASLESHIEKMHSEDKQLKMGYVTGYGVERRFHCTECPYVCSRRQALDYHMTTHTGLKPFQCDVCNKSFAQHGALNSHRKIHSDKMYFTCQECGKQFKHKEKYVKHRVNVHQNKDVRHYCNICNKGLKTQKTLTEHMNRHMQIKNYSCEFCGKSMVTRVDLVLHLRVHKKDKMFKCIYCEYSTYSKKTLAIHINRHTKARSFQCEHCEYMCYTRGELKFHTRKHTKEQNYSCPLCDTKFRYSSSVNKHMLKKHGEKYKWNDTVDRRLVK